MKTLLILTTTVSLLMVDFLAFHDIREPHTFRDWLTLFASLLVFFYFGRELSKGSQPRGYSS
jgi:hypothetical protein